MTLRRFAHCLADWRLDRWALVVVRCSVWLDRRRLSRVRFGPRGDA